MTAKTGPRHLAEPPTFSFSWALTDEQLDRTMEQLKGEFEPAFWDALVDARVAAIVSVTWTTDEMTVRTGRRGWERVTFLVATIAVEPWHPAPLTNTGRRVKVSA